MNEYNLLCISYLFTDYVAEKYLVKICGKTINFSFFFQGETCCWVCDDCKPWEFMLDKFSCEECELGFWPDTNFTGCYELPLQVCMYIHIIDVIHTHSELSNKFKLMN